MVWKGASLPRLLPQSGRGIAIGAIAAGASNTVAVTFPAAYPVAPMVYVIPYNARLTPGLVSVSTTGFSVSFGNWSGGNMAGTTFDWTATPA